MSTDVSICEQLQCGAIDRSQLPSDLLQACYQAGYAGLRSCSDSVCDPYLGQMDCAPMPEMPSVVERNYVPTFMPRATTQSLPNMMRSARIQKASLGGIVPDTSMFSPTSLLQPLPQIVPSPAGELVDASCDGFSAWVAANPLLAIGGLVAAYFLIAGNK